MRTRSTAGDTGEARQVRRQFERWRKQRRGGARIPEELWRAAVGLVPELGVSKTSQFLRLDYYSLKKRAEAEIRHASVRAQFVEVPMVGAGGATGGGGACVLEVEDPNGGVRLRLDLRGMAAPDLGRLVRSVLGTDR